MAVNVSLTVVDTVRDIAVRAGREIMAVYETDFDVQTKRDATPVTEADHRAEALIDAAIRAELSDKWPIVAEEAVEAGRIPNVKGGPFWLVDPLDGTKQFVNRQGEFTVNIALIDAGKPVMGVVHAPAIGETYWASQNGAFARIGDGEPQAIRVRKAPADGLTVAVSRSHRTPEVDKFLEAVNIREEYSRGSSIKFCMVASGNCDLYPRLGRTMEWDTAAGHAVVRYAGGQVLTLDGNELTYGKDGFENPHFVVKGDPLVAPVG